jgi:universal stress protein A
MKNYQKILVAVDLNDEALILIDRAKKLLKPQGELHIIHVSSVLADLYPVSAMGSAIPVEIASYQQKYIADSQDYLQKLASKAGINESHMHLIMGMQAQQIKKVAEQKQVDLIVIGVHEKNRLASLLGSVANGVLHNTPCDVLSVAI